MGCTETSIEELGATPCIPSSLKSEKKSKDQIPLYNLYRLYLCNLNDNTYRLGMRPFPLWAESPTSVACEAVSFLNQFKLISDDKLLTEFSGAILSNIGRDRALNQHLVYFLYRNATIDHPQFISSLVGKGLFSQISPFLMDSNPHFRSYTMKLFTRLLRFNDLAMSLFHKSTAINFVIAQLFLRSTNRRTLKSSIKLFRFLLKSPTHGKVFAEIMVKRLSTKKSILKGIQDQKLLREAYALLQLINKNI